MDANPALLPTYRALPEADLVLAHESALVAAGAAVQEALHHATPRPAANAPDTRISPMQKLWRYLFPKRSA